MNNLRSATQVLRVTPIMLKTTVAFLCAQTLATAATTGAITPPDFPDIQLPGTLRGDAAVTILTSQLPALAAFYRTSDQELRERLQGDKSLWVDPRGRLFYVCDWGKPPSHGDEAENVSRAIVFTYADTFRLHSRPGGTKLIYLDFDGHDASATSWGSDAIGRPFDLDSNPSTFSTTERDNIHQIWQRVAEDFAMYDVDVTTEDPGVEALRKVNTSDSSYGIRVVIGGSSSDWYGSAGGVAYIGSFDWNSDTPCWVWPGSLANSEKNIAEAASHEAGHTLGLGHDGLLNGTTYYTGQGNWAPIMGVGYSKPITQWSKGEYANANNTQDDLAVMLAEGITYRVDDHGNSIATATALNGVSITVTGNIERTTDLDFFSFQTGAGRVYILVTPAPRGPNLHASLSLFDSNGSLITSASAADNSAGVLPTTLSTVLPTGTYYLSLDGTGSANPVTDGYSDYASLGEYTITATLPSDSAWIPTAEGTDYSWTDAANWASNTIPLGVDASARINNNIVGDQTISLNMPITVGKLFLGDVNASHSFTVQDGSGGSLYFSTTSGNASLSKVAGTNDTISASLVLESDLIVTNTTASGLLLSGIISGSRGLMKSGPGGLKLSGANTYGGSTVVGAGILSLEATASIASSTIIDVRASAIFDATAGGGLTLSDGQMLSGAGVVLGDVIALAGAQIAPGTNGAGGTLTLSNRLTLNSGSKLNYDLADSPTPGGNTNDLLVVTGDLDLSGTVTVAFNFLNGFPASPATYTLITYSGTLNGAAANLVAVDSTNRYVFTFDDSIPGVIRVQISGAPASLVWQGDGTTNRWDMLGAANWLDGAILSPFYQLDSVTFDDAGSASPAVSLVGVLKPGTITVGGIRNYSFSGSGRISGTAALTKQGNGTLTINTTNDYSGLTLINAGTVKAGNAAALGSTNGGTTVNAGATLDLNSFNLGSETVTAQGAGTNGAGAIISASAFVQSNALRFVALSGDTTFGGIGRWDIRANPTASFAGNNFTLTKTGPNETWLANVGASGLGDINVNQGLLGIQGSTTLGDAAKTLTIASNASFGIQNTDYNVLGKRLVMNGGGLHSTSGDNSLAGGITLNGSNVITASAVFTLQGPISGPGGLTKLGSGILSLNAANTYTGATFVSAGTLLVRTASALGATNGGTTITSGARLDLNGLNLGAEMVTVQGTGLGNAGSIINNGPSQQNALRFVTLAGNTTFGGIGRWDIRANPTGSLTGNNFSLTKTGGNEIWLVGLGDSGLSSITISEGLLGIQASTTLGRATNTLTINSAGTLGIFATGTNILTKLTGMSGGRIYNANGNNTLAGTISLSGSNRLDIATGTTLILSGILGGSGSLHKISGGSLVLTTNNAYSGPTAIQAGILQIGNGGGAGSPGTGNITNNAALTFNRSNTLTVANQISGTGALTKTGPGTLILSGANTYVGGTTVLLGTSSIDAESRLGANPAAPFKPAQLTLNGGGLQTTATFVLDDSNRGITLGSSGGIFNVNSGTTLTLANTVTGSGSLTKFGAGTLTLSAANNYVGSTVLSNGTLALGAAGTISTSPMIRVDTGATFNVTAVTGGFVLANGQTLAGNGTVVGAVVANGSVSPGASVGRLTFTDSLTLGGTTLMEVARNGMVLTNDLISVSGALTYGGVLVVTNTGNALIAGDTFQLFNAPAYNGIFSTTTLPALNPGLRWNTAQLNTAGVIQVTNTGPQILPLTVVGTNLMISLQSEAGVTYVLDAAPALDLPIVWTSIATNFGTGDVLTFPTPIDPLLPQRFFRVVLY